MFAKMYQNKKWGIIAHFTLSNTLFNYMKTAAKLATIRHTATEVYIQYTTYVEALSEPNEIKIKSI
jgi:hypothetical protein